MVKRNASDLCAVILAGGKSSRMGSNKALLDFGGRPLIGVLADRVRLITNRILISSNDPACYEFLNLPVIPDHHRDRGPLAGLHAAMLWNECSLYIVLACDLPNLRAPLLRKLTSLVKGYDVAIPRTRDGIAHPLCAVYRRTCLPTVENSLLRGVNKMIEILEEPSLSIRWVESEEGGFEDDDLANITTPEDLRRLESGFDL